MIAREICGTRTSSISRFLSCTASLQEPYEITLAKLVPVDSMFVWHPDSNTIQQITKWFFIEIIIDGSHFFCCFIQFSKVKSFFTQHSFPPVGGPSPEVIFGIVTHPGAPRNTPVFIYVKIRYCCRKFKTKPRLLQKKINPAFKFFRINFLCF